MAGVGHEWKRLVRVNLMESSIDPLVESMEQLSVISLKFHEHSILELCMNIEVVSWSQDEMGLIQRVMNDYVSYGMSQLVPLNHGTHSI